MGSPAAVTRLVAALAGLLLAHSLAAQSPIGDPLPATIADSGLNDFPTQTVLANGDLLLVWENAVAFEEGNSISFQARRLSLHDPPGPVMTLAQGFITDDSIGNPLVAPRTDGGFLLTFVRARGDDTPGCRATAFSTAGEPLSAETEIAPDAECAEGLVALADGTFATTWLRSSPPDEPRLRVYRMFVRLSALGEPISRPRQINPRALQSSPGFDFGSFAGNAAGDVTLVWDGNRARSFSVHGGPLGPPSFLRFNGGHSPAIAVLPNGNRIFTALNNPLGPLGGVNYVAYQRFAADGTPLGPLRKAHAPRDAFLGDPAVGADSMGNFAIAWGGEPGISCARLQTRLFRSDGKSVGRELVVGLVDGCEARPHLSFLDNGTFALSWVDELGMNVAWYSASPADEFCLVRSGHLLCDTGRTGGEPEIDQRVDETIATVADTLFLADFDGDGRADPCSHAGASFTCDLDHRGRELSARIDFGTASDLPLMGDLDGDGRADACVRRGDLLACDTGHDGGAAELEERFGHSGDVVLLGDVNGDRRDDLCERHDGAFLCDTAHDGGAAERTFVFGVPGDLAVLGDFDGDGRDDPCVLRGDTLWCDTRHDGGAAEGSVHLRAQPGDRIVMGNLDGL